jgi:hypothetical protein
MGWKSKINQGAVPFTSLPYRFMCHPSPSLKENENLSLRAILRDLAISASFPSGLGRYLLGCYKPPHLLKVFYKRFLVLMTYVNSNLPVLDSKNRVTSPRGGPIPI